MTVQVWTYIFVGLTFGLYMFIAWRSRVKDTKGFFVAGQGVPAVANGVATAADWMSAASFISMAGIISTMGFAGGQYLMGWTGGYVLLALLLAPYLRKFGHYTVPDFVGDRYESHFARLVAVLCAIFVSFTYVAGQMRGVGVVFGRFLEVPVEYGVVIGMVIVFVYATLGGMKGVTWTQVAQYWVLITAFLVPAIAISFKLTGMVIPQVGMGAVIDVDGEASTTLLNKLDQINLDLGFSKYTEAFGFDDSTKLLNLFCVTLALMAGTAGLPHVIVRFYTVKSIGAARWSAFWALLFIALLYLTAPATAAFARYYMIQTMNDKEYSVPVVASELTEGENGLFKTPDGRLVSLITKKGEKPFYSEIPSWFHKWEQTGLIVWLDANRDGKVFYSKRIEDNEVFNPGKESALFQTIKENHAAWLADPNGASGRKGQTALLEYLNNDKGSYSKHMGPDKDIIVLATPEMAGLYSWIIALVAAGGLAAALSTASGLLLVISSSVAHDLYFRVVNPEASEKRRLLVGRGVIGMAIVVAGLLGIYPPAFVGEVVAFAFGLAAASFFPAIVLGIFTKRVGTVPAVVGMLVGIGFTTVYIYQTVFLKQAPWFFEIGPKGIGTIGMILNFIVTLALTPFFKPPSPRVKDMISNIREPELGEPEPPSHAPH